MSVDAVAAAAAFAAFLAVNPVGSFIFFLLLVASDAGNKGVAVNAVDGFLFLRSRRADSLDFLLAGTAVVAGCQAASPCLVCWPSEVLCC